MRSREGWSVRWFLAPWALGFVLLTALPAALCIFLSLTRTDNPLRLQRFGWAGFEHYHEAIAIDARPNEADSRSWPHRLFHGRPRSPRFYRSLGNTVFFTFLAVPLGLIISLSIALLLQRAGRGMAAARACVYLPHLLSGIATVVIWAWLLNPRFGPINQAIRGGYKLLDPAVRLFSERGTADWPVPQWLHSPRGCKPALILMHVWTMGGAMLVFLAALRRIPRILYESAAVDGTNAWKRFRHVTLPQISPAILFNAVVSVAFAMQIFQEAYVLQNPRQRDGLLFYVVNLYREAFEPPYRIHYACALGVIFWLFILALLLPLFLLSKRWVYYAQSP